VAGGGGGVWCGRCEGCVGCVGQEGGAGGGVGIPREVVGEVACGGGGPGRVGRRVGRVGAGWRPGSAVAESREGGWEGRRWCGGRAVCTGGRGGTGRKAGRDGREGGRQEAGGVVAGRRDRKELASLGGGKAEVRTSEKRTQEAGRQGSE